MHGPKAKQSFFESPPGSAGASLVGKSLVISLHIDMHSAVSEAARKAPGSSSNRLFCRATVAGRSRSNSRQSSSTGRSRSNSQSSTSRSSSRPAMDEVAVVGKVAAVGDSN